MFHFKPPERILSSLQKHEVRFEYDPSKSESNKEKHGIDFEEAQALWDGPVFAVSTYAGNDDERTLNVGVIEGKYWTAITTDRDGMIRIISVRRARDYEREAYDDCLDR